MFDIFGYLITVEERLNLLGRERRLAFAGWCCDPLLEEAGEYLAHRHGPTSARAIQSFYQSVWDHILSGAPISADEAERVQSLCAEAFWEDDDDESAESQLLANAAVESLESLALVCEVAKSGSARAAARTAEKIINRIDFELGMVLGVTDPFAHELMTEELARQQQMLDFLAAAPALKAEVRRQYRTRQ